MTPNADEIARMRRMGLGQQAIAALLGCGVMTVRRQGRRVFQDERAARRSEQIEAHRLRKDGRIPSHPVNPVFAEWLMGLPSGWTLPYLGDDLE